jgi:tetraacyldisaccharide 4'-kinase
VVVSLHGPLHSDLRPYLRRDALVAEARYVPVGWRLRGEDLPVEALEGRDAIALVGVARPAAFLDAVRVCGVRVQRSFVFPDHHAFTWHDLQALESWLGDHLVVTTEKDAARLPPDAAVHVLRVALAFVSGEAALRERLAQALHAEAAAP